jgi:tRNA dimethylallyltransferase
MAANRKTMIVIAGPTAVGKTSVAIDMAKHFKTEIISADSRQCFKELNIAVAKPSPAQLKQVKHHFINSHSVKDEVNAKVFEDYALAAAQKIFSAHDIAMMVGGTGLYIKTFCEGIDEVPAIDTKIRDVIVTNYNNGGIEWLRKQVQQNDAEFFLKGEIQNPRRMIRALEVKLSTGQSILSFHSRQKKKRDFTIIKIGLQLPKEQLHHNINTRVDQMIEKGLTEEVKSLQPLKHLNALQTVGYSEIFDYLDRKFSLDEAINAIKANTRQYAKRQTTWFRKDKEIKWFAPAQVNEIIEFIEKRNN